MNVAEFQQAFWVRIPFHTSTYMILAMCLWEDCIRDISIVEAVILADCSLPAVLLWTRTRL
jgi:hypothetical protein